MIENESMHNQSTTKWPDELIDGVVYGDDIIPNQLNDEWISNREQKKKNSSKY